MANRQTLRIATVVGARPQFVKAAPLSQELAAAEIEEIGIHTGQHFDENMSGVFFRDLGIPRPRHMLDIHGGGHGEMTGRMLAAIEIVLIADRPDAVLVYGDTNSTLAGALAASKLHIPVIHVEAGLRSFNRAMPEEINRVLTDHVSNLLFCPTSLAVRNLTNEGISEGVHQVGDLMYDATLQMTPIALSKSQILGELAVKPKGFNVATIHRAENTEGKQALSKALQYVSDLSADRPTVFPVHPRTRAVMESHGLKVDSSRILLTEPIGYLDMQALLANANLLITDSGGMQKEAFFHRIPCITMRSETEWVETIESGWNRLWSESSYRTRRDIEEYGSGSSAKAIVDRIQATLG